MKVSLLVFALIVLCSKLFSQDISSDIGYEQLLTSPTVRGFEKYGEFNVNLNSGVIDQSIPIYTLQEGDFQLPITLSYLASGIKVNELASWTGLGWTLNYGGVITRQVRGLPDEKNYTSSINNADDLGDNNNGYFSTAKALKNDYDEIINSPKLCSLFGLNQLDSKPDIFYFNFNGRSGKIIFGLDSNDNLKPFIISKDNLKINWDYQLNSWEIITENGVKYVFDLKEHSAYSGEDAQNGAIAATSAWFLSKIVTTKNRLIKFEYCDDVIRYMQHGGEKNNYVISNYSNGSSAEEAIRDEFYDDHFAFPIFYTHSTKKISKIIGSNIEIVFKSKKERVDLKNKALLLDKIEIKSKSTSRQYSYQFEYDYFNSQASYLNAETNYLNLRLKLNSISRVENSNSIPFYSFGYEESINLPTQISYAQDNWGYYNGQISNDQFWNNDIMNRISYLMPSMEYVYGNPYDNNSQVRSYLTGSNRKTSEITNFASANILTRIDYPTGGHSTFEYEQNEFSSYLGNPINDTIFSNILTRLATVNYPPSQYLGVKTKNISFSLLGSKMKIDLNAYEYHPSVPSNSKAVITITGPSGYNFSYTLSLSEGNNSLEKTLLDLTSGQYLLKIETIDAIVGGSIDKSTQAISQIKKSRKAGGVRIRKIMNFDENNILGTKEYQYNKDNNISSGEVCSEFPKYGELQEYSTYRTMNNLIVYAETGNILAFQRHSTPVNRNIFSKNIVSYTSVTEILNGEQKKQSKYSSYSEYPDQYYPKYMESETLSYMHKRDRSYRRGAIKSLLMKEDGNTVSSKTFNYTYSPEDYIPSYNFNLTKKSFPIAATAYNCKHDLLSVFTSFVPLIERFYRGRSMLSETIEVIDNIERKEMIDFDSDYLLPIKKTVTGSGKTYITDYTYCFNTTNTDPVYNMMQDSNIINPVVSIKNYIDIGTSVFIDEKTVKYKNYTEIIAPQEIKSRTATSNLRNEITFEKYDQYGNVLQYKTNDGITVSIVYGYNNMLPVAKVENATYSQIEALFGGSIPILGASGLNQTQISNIINGLPNSFVTTYKFDPLIGMISQTDPNGIKTDYEYDDFGRLEYVKDNDGNILSKNKYHYKNQ